MSTLRQFKLPDVGEGLTEGEILQWLVSVGDTVTVNQPLCEVETAKAAVELPSPYAGTVTQLMFEAGTTVDVGAPIITIDVGGDGGDTGGGTAGDTAGADQPAGSGLIGEQNANGRTSVLVGYGPRNTEAKRRPRRNRAAAAARAAAPPPPAGRPPEAGGPSPRPPPAVRPAPPLVLPEADYGSGAGRPPLLAT